MNVRDGFLYALITVSAGTVGAMVGLIAALDAYEAWDKWQTLISGFLAVGAAIGTAWVIVQQIRSSEHGVEKQIQAQREISVALTERKLLASRAVFPTDLSTVMDYAEESAKAITQGILYVRARAAAPPEITLTPLPDRVISNLQNLIEHLDKDSAIVVADLLGCYQIQYSRLSGVISDIRNPTVGLATRITTEQSFDGPILSTLELSARAELLFSFARRQVDKASLSPYQQGDFLSIAFRLDLSDVVNGPELNQLTSLLERRFAKICEGAPAGAP